MMKIAQCSACGAKFDVSRHEPGKKVRCGRCKSVFQVPGDADAVTGAAPAVAPKRTPTRAMAQVPASQRRAADEESAPSETEGAADESGQTEGEDETASARRARLREKPAKSSSTATMIGAAAVVAAIALGAAIYFLSGNAGQGDNAEPEWLPKLKAEFKQKYDATDRTNPDQLFDLYKWCAQWPQVFGKEADELLARLVEVKPDHPGAIGRIRAICDEKLAEARQTNTEDGWLALAEFAGQYNLKEECELAANAVVKINRNNERANRLLGRVPMKNEKGETVWEDAAIAAEFIAQNRGREEENEMFAQLDERGKQVWTLAKDKYGNITGASDPWIWKSSTPLKAENTDWLLCDYKPYVVFIEKSAKYSAEVRVEEIATVLKDLIKLFFATYGEKFNLTAMDDKVITVVIFKDRASYLEKTGASLNAAAHYDPGNECLMLPNDLPDMYGVVFHEGTHQLVDFAAKLRGKESGRPFWFEEGIATNFEAFFRDKDTGAFTIGAVSGLPQNDYLATIKGMIRQKTYKPFKQMVGMSYLEGSKDPNPMQIGMNYAQAWSMVFFLYTYDNCKYRSKWDEYFVAEISGEGGKQAFEKIVGDPEAIEKEWLEYMPTVSEKK